MLNKEWMIVGEKTTATEVSAVNISRFSSGMANKMLLPSHTI